MPVLLYQSVSIFYLSVHSKVIFLCTVVIFVVVVGFYVAPINHGFIMLPKLEPESGVQRHITFGDKLHITTSSTEALQCGRRLSERNHLCKHSSAHPPRSVIRGLFVEQYPFCLWSPPEVYRFVDCHRNQPVDTTERYISCDKDAVAWLFSSRPV